MTTSRAVKQSRRVIFFSKDYCLKSAVLIESLREEHQIELNAVTLGNLRMCMRSATLLGGYLFSSGHDSVSGLGATEDN